MYLYRFRTRRRPLDTLLGTLSTFVRPAFPAQSRKSFDALSRPQGLGDDSLSSLYTYRPVVPPSSHSSPGPRSPRVDFFLRIPPFSNLKTTMRSSVVVISSVNASFNTTSRNIYVGERDLEMYRPSTSTAPGTRVVRGPSQIPPFSRLIPFYRAL